MDNSPRKTHWLLPSVLSITAGSVDVIGFLSLGGLFTSLITGNLVILAVHYVTGRLGELGPLLSVPVFVAILGFVALTFGASEKPRASRRAFAGLARPPLSGLSWDWGLARHSSQTGIHGIDPNHFAGMDQAFPLGVEYFEDRRADCRHSRNHFDGETLVLIRQWVDQRPRGRPMNSTNRGSKDTS
jgi:hypothetical protein